MTREKRQRPTLKAVPSPSAEAERPIVDVDPSECSVCFGTGMEIVDGKGARPCGCRKVRSQEGQFARVRLPRRYDGFHFGNYHPRTEFPLQQRALRRAMQFAMEYPAVERGLLFMGDVGVGKTHLAVSILKGLTERGFRCLFYDFGSLLKEIQDSYNPYTQTSELGVLAPVLSTEVLVLDELGASKPTEWVQDTLAHIINSRYNEKKFTVFTTNYLDDRSDPRRETLEDRIGVRTRSRLYEMCETVLMNGDDFRKTFDRGTSPTRRTTAN